MEGERIVFTEEGQPNQYLKLVASGAIDDGLLEALEDFVKRQRKRLAAVALLHQPLEQFVKPSWADKQFRPGDIVPAETPFHAHHVGHGRDQLIEPDKGDEFPTCEQCGDQVRYTLA